MSKPLSDEVKQQWKEKILQQRSSGLSIPAWCRQHAVAVCNFRYWQSKLFPASFSRTSFTELSPASKSAGIFLEYREIKIYLEPKFDPQTLRQCLEVIKRC